MATDKTLKLIAVEVEELLATNPEIKKIFQEQIGVWREHRLIYRKKRKELEDAGLWGEREILDPVGIKYWAYESDKRPIYYTYVAMAYDFIKSEMAPYELCRNILDEENRAILRMEVSGGSDDSFLDTALRWIKLDPRLATAMKTKADLDSDPKKDRWTMSNSKNEKTEKLQEISKSVLILKNLSVSPAERLEMGGRLIAKAFELGAFNRQEHITLRNAVEFRLSQKNVNPYISAWGETLVWLKHKKPPFPPSDLDKSFSADCELVAKAVLEEAKVIEQADLPSTKQNGATAKKRYLKPVIIAALITAVATILAPVIVWFLNSHSKNLSIPSQKNDSTFINAETKGNLSPAVVTYGPNSPVNIYQTPTLPDANSENKEIDVNRPK
jgi:hypothetical protein